MAKIYSDKIAFKEEFPRRNMSENWRFYNEEIHPNVRTGDLIFCSGNALMSKAIQWKSKSVWSHSGMIVRLEEMDRVFVLESVETMGVRLIPLSKVLYDYEGNRRPYQGRVFIGRHQDVNPLNAPQIITHGMDLLTSRYDDAEYFRIFLRILLGKEKLQHNRQYMCSELVHQCFLQADIYLKYDKGLFISPGAIWANDEVDMLYQMI
jgi:hypothetical protein